MTKLTDQSVDRMTELDKVLIYQARFWTFTKASDRRYARNNKRLRKVFKEIIDNRRQNLGSDDSNDMLSILLNSEIYSKDDELMKDELFTMFLAGMKTIQISTTNLIYYVTRDL
jgi:cytochrome P450